MFTDEEWELIREMAARENMSAREYISWLVSEHKNRLLDEENGQFKGNLYGRTAEIIVK